MCTPNTPFFLSFFLSFFLCANAIVWHIVVTGLHLFYILHWFTHVSLLAAADINKLSLSQNTPTNSGLRQRPTCNTRNITSSLPLFLLYLCDSIVQFVTWWLQYNMMSSVTMLPLIHNVLKHFSTHSGGNQSTYMAQTDFNHVILTKKINY